MERVNDYIYINGFNKDDKMLVAQKQADFVEYLKDIMATPSIKESRIKHLLNNSIYSCPCLTIQKMLKNIQKHYKNSSIKPEIYNLFQNPEFKENMNCRCGDEEVIYDLEEKYSKLHISESAKSNLINEAMKNPYIQELLKRDQYISTIESNLKLFKGDASDLKDVCRCIYYLFISIDNIIKDQFSHLLVNQPIKLNTNFV